jgi:hypothetical protein
MKSNHQHMNKLALPTLLLVMMAGCASVSDLESVQKQLNEVKATASAAAETAKGATDVANNANTTAEEAKALATEARHTASGAAAISASAQKTASDASGFAADAVKNTEAAVGVALQAQKSVGDPHLMVPTMRLDPVTGRVLTEWVALPSPVGAPQAPAAIQPAPATGAAPAPDSK